MEKSTNVFNFEPIEEFECSQLDLTLRTIHLKLHCLELENKKIKKRLKDLIITVNDKDKYISKLKLEKEKIKKRSKDEQN